MQYEVKSPRCHEMRLAAPPHDCIRFNFRCDREAEEWATVVMSSLREAQRGQFDDYLTVLLSFMYLFVHYYFKGPLFLHLYLTLTPEMYMGLLNICVNKKKIHSLGFPSYC